MRKVCTKQTQRLSFFEINCFLIRGHTSEVQQSCIHPQKTKLHNLTILYLAHHHQMPFNTGTMLRFVACSTISLLPPLVAVGRSNVNRFVSHRSAASSLAFRRAAGIPRGGGGSDDDGGDDADTGREARPFSTLTATEEGTATSSATAHQPQRYETLSTPAPGSPFHYAFPVHSLGLAKEFYGNVLGCQEGRSSEKWQDFALHGHQIVCHWVGNDYRCVDYYNPVDGGK